MSRQNAKDRRWLRSVITAAAEPLPEFHWMRAGRRRPASLAQDHAGVSPATTDAVTPHCPAFPDKGAVAAR